MLAATSLLLACTGRLLLAASACRLTAPRRLCWHVTPRCRLLRKRGGSIPLRRRRALSSIRQGIETQGKRLQGSAHTHTHDTKGNGWGGADRGRQGAHCVRGRWHGWSDATVVRWSAQLLVRWIGAVGASFLAETLEL